MSSFLAMSTHAKLTFSRHGESEWNVANKSIGWVNVDLSEKGVGEVKGAGELIKEAGYQFDLCYTSYLKRGSRQAASPWSTATRCTFQSSRVGG